MIKPNRKMTAAEFWLLSCTWGILMTIAGLLVGLIFLVCGFRPIRNQYGWVFEFKRGWGGVSIGPVSIVSQGVSQHTLNHEFGHSVQNCYYGPFHILVSLASAARYWYREYLVNRKGYKYWDLPDYDSVWFEAEATRVGNYYHEH